MLFSHFLSSSSAAILLTSLASTLFYPPDPTLFPFRSLTRCFSFFSCTHEKKPQHSAPRLTPLLRFSLAPPGPHGPFPYKLSRLRAHLKQSRLALLALLRRCVHFRHTIFPGILRDFRATNRGLFDAPEALPTPEAPSTTAAYRIAPFCEPFSAFRERNQSTLCDTRDQKKDVGYYKSAHTTTKKARAVRIAMMMFHHFFAFWFPRHCC